MKVIPLALATALLPLAGPALSDAHTAKGMSAEVVSSDGISGTVSAMPEASGVMVVKIDLAGVPAGEHAVHIHESGDCSADDYSSAGGHLTGGMEHGVMVEGGPHAGDLPNVMVGEDGLMQETFFKPDLTAEMLADEDGAGFIVHAGADDYESQPAGDAGSRIACAVLVAPK